MTTVVLVDPRRPSLIPVEAVVLLAGDVQYTEEMPVKVPWSLPAARPAYTGVDAPVLLSSDPDHPMVREWLAAGATLISVPAPKPGEHLVDAVAIMDALRTAGPWEREQTHDTLRRYLLEETYELFDAIRGGNADEIREELGDVLLQVLFQARIGQDAAERPVRNRRRGGCPGPQTRQPGADSACRRVDLTGRPVGAVGGTQGDGEVGEGAPVLCG